MKTKAVSAAVKKTVEHTRKRTAKVVSQDNENNRIEYNANFKWDEESSVWTVTSDDIIGLALEDESLDSLIFKVQDAVPELLELNGQKPASRIKCSIKNRQLVYV